MITRQNCKTNGLHKNQFLENTDDIIFIINDIIYIIQYI